MKARVVALALAAAACAPPPEVRVGSKAFTESVLLGEVVSHLARSAGSRVDHRRGLGGTRVLWSALLAGEIDVYPEYTGTIAEEILARPGIRDEEVIREALAAQGVRMGLPLGFNNTYAIGVKRDLAERLGLRALSDHPQGQREHPPLVAPHEGLEGSRVPRLGLLHQLPVLVPGARGRRVARALRPVHALLDLARRLKVPA